MNFDALIFDLGGVIINLDYKRTIHAFEQLGMEDFHTIYSQATQTNLFDDFETGKISAQRFINSLLPYLKPGTTPNKVVHAWNAMILDVPPEKLQLLESFRGKYPVYLLSNTNELHIPVVRREWSKITSLAMEHFFDRIFFSHEIHLRKPDRAVFEYVCEKEGLIPDRTLFIDDSIQHIQGASDFGLQTIHLTEHQSLGQLFS
ncbi:MAG: HAD family hydrolase [Flavobacteriia bacterium]